MKIQELFEQNRSAILDRWRDLILDSYPKEAGLFFRAEGNRFHNPVGHSIARATEVLYDGVVLEREPGQVPEALETLVRLRAVQDFSASQAVAFCFLLKRVLREFFEEAGGGGGSAWLELAAVERHLDELTASAFDLYARCREQVFEIRQNELKRRVASLLKQLGERDPAPPPPRVAGADGLSKRGSGA
jgi:hypothetical protein